jgi:hypothetical protein
LSECGEHRQCSSRQFLPPVCKLATRLLLPLSLLGRTSPLLPSPTRLRPDSPTFAPAAVKKKTTSCFLFVFASFFSRFTKRRDCDNGWPGVVHCASCAERRAYCCSSHCVCLRRLRCHALLYCRSAKHQSSLRGSSWCPNCRRVLQRIGICFSFSTIRTESRSFVLFNFCVGL